MKNYKKLLSIALAMAMTTAMAVPGFADTTTTPIDSVNDVNKNYSITINNSETGHTYEVYQILVGDIYGTTTTDDENGTVDTTGTLSNIRWGSSITEAGKAELLGENTDWSAADYAKTLKSESDAIDMAATLNADDEYLGNFVGSDSTPEEGKYVIENLVPGYYLIKDASESLAEETDVYTSYIVQLLGFVVMEPKNTIDDSTPQNVAKYVTDINDSTGNSAEKQDSADYDIGDEVPFLLSATVPEKFDDFDVYKLTFYDNLDDHFAVPEDDDITVKAGEVPLTKDTDYTIKRTGLPEGYDFAIVFADLHEVNGVSADTVITVEYSAELKSNAVIGAGGNVNSMYVEYSNNPNDETG